MALLPGYTKDFNALPAQVHLLWVVRPWRALHGAKAKPVGGTGVAASTYREGRSVADVARREETPPGPCSPQGAYASGVVAPLVR
jgi:hypothetical protein